jgi:hypothetical protein
LLDRRAVHCRPKVCRGAVLTLTNGEGSLLFIGPDGNPLPCSVSVIITSNVQLQPCIAVLGCSLNASAC